MKNMCKDHFNRLSKLTVHNLTAKPRYSILEINTRY